LIFRPCGELQIGDFEGNVNMWTKEIETVVENIERSFSEGLQTPKFRTVEDNGGGNVGVTMVGAFAKNAKNNY
jgi:hypothetical protein